MSLNNQCKTTLGIFVEIKHFSNVIKNISKLDSWVIKINSSSMILLFYNLAPLLKSIIQTHSFV